MEIPKLPSRNYNTPQAVQVDHESSFTIEVPSNVRKEVYRWSNWVKFVSFFFLIGGSLDLLGFILESLSGVISFGIPSNLRLLEIFVCISGSIVGLKAVQNRSLMLVRIYFITVLVDYVVTLIESVYFISAFIVVYCTFLPVGTCDEDFMNFVTASSEVFAFAVFSMLYGGVILCTSKLYKNLKIIANNIGDPKYFEDNTDIRL
jgi:hypothetical protein